MSLKLHIAFFICCIVSHAIDNVQYVLHLWTDDLDYLNCLLHNHGREQSIDNALCSLIDSRSPCIEKMTFYNTSWHLKNTFCDWLFFLHALRTQDSRLLVHTCRLGKTVNAQGNHMVRLVWLSINTTTWRLMMCDMAWCDATWCNITIFFPLHLKLFVHWMLRNFHFNQILLSTDIGINRI